MLETKSEVDGTLWTNINGVAAKDGFKGFSSDKHGWDDGVAVSGGTCILAAAFLPILLNAFFVLVIEVFALCQRGRSIIIEFADASFEGVLACERVVDDFGSEIVGIAEIERRLVVEILDGVACTDRDGINYLGRIGLYCVGRIKDVVWVCRGQKVKWRQGEKEKNEECRIKNQE